ncbi:MAG: FtsW/RodA/SpoVE family cell cycle protein [Dehalococcoidia bacterium]
MSLLRHAGAGLVSGQRNIEMVLLTAALGFGWVGWRALELSGTELPGDFARILTQFALATAAGHLLLRLVAPRAIAQPFAAAMLLCAIGLAFVARLQPSIATDQVNWITLGIALAVAAAWGTRWLPLLRDLKYTCAFAAGLLLLVTGLFGTTINGARLWITISGQTIQSTEIIKLLLVAFLAGYLADHGAILTAQRLKFGGRSYSALPYLIPLGLTWAFALLAIAWLRDLGAIALLLLLAVSALFVATGRVRFLSGGVIVLALTSVLAYYAFGHAQERIDIWLDPFDQASGPGYQTVQSLYAFQAGGVTGEGLGLGSPGVIPAAHTDYMFAAIGEELGTAGALGVALIFAVLVIASFRIAAGARNDYEAYLAAFTGLLIGIQAAVIVAGNLRLIPTTGITLPFVSYGGSSLLVNFVLLGMLLGISERSTGTD